MAERSTINQSVQIGVETTPGTAVAASRRLGSLGFSLGPSTEFRTQRPTGQKYASLHILGKEWAEASVEGSPVYPELPYLFASVVNSPTVTAIQDAGSPTGAYRWRFSSATFGNDTPKTFTIEQGDSVRAHRVTNGIVTSTEFGWSRDELTLSGNLIARAIEDGVTMTASPTGLPQIPVKPADLSVYLDEDSAGLGTTKMTRAISGTWSLGDRFNPLWVVDRAQPSFVTTIEGEPSLSSSLRQQADAQGLATLLAMRGGQTRFMRLEAKGPVIHTPGAGDPIRHSLTIDIAGQVNEVSSFEDEDGVYAIEWTFGGVHDPVWGKAFDIEVITTTAAL